MVTCYLASHVTTLDHLDGIIKEFTASIDIEDEVTKIISFCTQFLQVIESLLGLCKRLAKKINKELVNEIKTEFKFDINFIVFYI